MQSSGVATQKAVLGGGRVQARAPVARASRPRVVACRAAGLSGKVKKVVLAYSGGLDTSVILKWLQDTYDCEVVTFTADLGQGEELEPARKKAEAAGVKEIYIDDLREEFVRDFVFPMFRANSLYEGTYLLGTWVLTLCPMGPPARETTKYYGLKPDIKVIAPWREWDLNSRTKLIAYAETHGIGVPAGKRNEPPFSMDANLLHISYEGNALEDPWVEPSESMFTRSVSPEQAPDTPTYVEIEFEKGDPVGINGTRMSPATLLTELNRLGGDNGIGRVDIVESRFVGMKSRGVYETPGGTILLAMRRAIESICLDRGESHLKDELMPKYAELVYNGFWFSPERLALQDAFDRTQQFVTGTVRAKLYKGNVIVVGRKSPYSLYDDKISSFEDDGGAYDQKDAAGFIKLQALRLRTLAKNRGDSWNKGLF
ncbi:Argininosuccinate synthase [Chlorella vulgaris]